MLEKREKKQGQPVHILVLGHCTKDHGFTVSTNKYKNSFVSKMKIPIKTHTDDV